MKKSSAILLRLLPMAGALLSAYVIYEAAGHRMSGTKLAIFWLGMLALGATWCYRIFARVKTFRDNGQTPKYSMRQRVMCGVFLFALLAAGVAFSRYTFTHWQEPPIYWKLVDQPRKSVSEFRLEWLLGNQDHRRSYRLDEIKLIHLTSVALAKDRHAFSISCRLDSLIIPFSDLDDASLLFKFPPGVELAPLRAHHLQMDFLSQNRFAIYEPVAVIRGDFTAKTLQTVSSGKYVIVEPARVEIASFARLKELLHQPSAQTGEAVVMAVGRSKHPEALAALLELLSVRDPRSQNAVCDALGELGDARATAALKQVVSSSDNARAVRALARIGSPETIDFLTNLLADTSEANFVRATAANALGESNARLAAPALAKLLTTGEINDAPLEREIILSLIKLGGEAATQAISDFARRPGHPSKVHELIRLLAETQRREVLPLFVEWLQDWRHLDLQLEDIQMMLDFIVAGDYREMSEPLTEILESEQDPLVQRRLAAALKRLAGIEASSSRPRRPDSRGQAGAAA